MRIIILWFLLLGLSMEARVVTDDYGRKVELPEKVTKIYASSPPLSMSLLAFDPELIAALNMPWKENQKPYVGTAYDKPVAGGFFGQGQRPNFEVLAKSKPDVIIMWGRMSGADKILKKLEKLGIPVLMIRNDSIKDLVSQFNLYGELTGNTKRAKELVDYTQETLSLIDSLQEKLAKQKPVRYYFAQGVDGLFSECKGSFHLEPFSYSWAENALDCDMSSNYGMEKISIESIVMADPDVIVAMEPFFVKKINQNKHFKYLRSVRKGKVYLVPSTPFNYITRPPSFMRLMGIRWLIHNFYPEILDVSFVSEQKRFEKVFFKNL
ncbi:ABC transporter substrate-binding protein [Sulfurimonas sp.]|uniref:ABC transporter substrate-binding protein n=1 Tax=Sulfurimonas sp. TaxID=2022749 RepID=UPI0035693122